MTFPIYVVLALYLVVAICLVMLSEKASVCVDLIDKKTSLSGAFIGGVMLSAVTSLPELFTSISATLLLDKPGLCMGNILGSNLFNLALLAVLVLIFVKRFAGIPIAKGHVIVGLFTLVIYAVIYCNYKGWMVQEFATVSVTSVVIFLLYILSVRSLSGEEGDLEDSGLDTSGLSVKQVYVRFALVSVGIVSLSILITYLTDGIAQFFHLGSGLAGALFLGIATSLPELASTVALFRMRNYNIALGNIIGSNLFNFMILSVADVLYLGNGIYDFSDPKTVNLLFCGLCATPAFLLMARWNSRVSCVVASVVTIVSYGAFLLI